MGYYSNYSLTFQPEEPAKPIIDWLKEHTGYTAGWHSYDGAICLNEAKWYDHQSDMAQLSAAFPSVKFELFCDGEDGDQWMVYAWQGKMEVCNSERVFEPRKLW